MAKRDFDKADYHILQRLRDNCRVPASELAKELGLATKTVQARIDKIQMIPGLRFAVTVEPEAFDYRTRVNIDLRADPARESSIVAELERCPEVTFISSGIDPGMLFVELQVHDNAEAALFIRSTLGPMPGVLDLEIEFTPIVFRHLHEWLPPIEDLAPSS